MKRQTLISLILLCSVLTMNAQIYGTLAGPSGSSNNVGIGTSTPNAKLEVGVSHAYNKNEEMRIGSYYNNNFYGIGLNHQIDGSGSPSSHIIYYSGGIKYAPISLYTNKVGIGVTYPSAKLEVGVRHAYNQDEEIRIGSYFNNNFYGIGFNYQIDGSGGPSNHIISYSGGTRYAPISLYTNKVGIGVTYPNAKLEVGVNHTINQDEEIRIGSYYNNGFYGLGLNYRINGSGGPSNHIVSYSGGTRYTTMSIVNDNVGIGITSPAYKLDVCGTIRAKEIKVDLQGGCDFVFRSDYKLMDLNTLEEFVKTNQHLPEIAPEKEMVENGVNVKELQMKLLQKIEELTLYAIEQNKSIEELKQIVQVQSTEIEKLKSASK